jgi:flagellar hook protein FlgE
MGVTASMETAVSGLAAHGEALGVISDNIVNSNTTGFKSSRAEFQTILAQDLLSSSGSEIGRGVSLAGVTTVFSQGAVIKTERATDTAINGNGFFVLKGDNHGLTYTRDGSFRFDKDGWLSSLGGQRVQAYGASPEGRLNGRMGDIRVPQNSIPSRSTKQIDLHVNLDARTVAQGPIDPKRPDETSQFTGSVQVFDSIGNSHPVSVHFNKTEDGSWDWLATTDGCHLDGGEKGKAEGIARGTLKFDNMGRLEKSEQTLLNTSFSNGAIPNQELQFNFGATLDKMEPGMEGSTQYGSKNAMFKNVQDGFSAGYLTDMSIDEDGTIKGNYTNGQLKILGQIALARFENPERLNKLGDNQFRESNPSGPASIGKPNSNGLGGLVTHSLENSNVDLSNEFVNMIKIQRGFQASAKSITTANEMLDDVINIKRN